MKKESKVNQAKYVELNLFPEEKEEHQKDSISSENMESDTSPDKEYDLTDLFERLSKSTFRSRFHLSKKDNEYIAEKGLATIRKHAEDFVAKRLAPAVIPNDGKQTPMRGHPVFIAQHATGCCCRGCFFKWHHIPAGRQLTGEEQQYAVAVLMAWIENRFKKHEVLAAKFKLIIHCCQFCRIFSQNWQKLFTPNLQTGLARNLLLHRVKAEAERARGTTRTLSNDS